MRQPVALRFAAVMFHAIVDDLILEFGGTETSGARTIAKNNAVGGNQYSYHLADLAKDVSFGGGVIDSTEQAFFEAACKKVGLQAIHYDTHTHVEMDLAWAIREWVHGEGIAT